MPSTFDKVQAESATPAHARLLGDYGSTRFFRRERKAALSAEVESPVSPGQLQPGPWSPALGCEDIGDSTSERGGCWTRAAGRNGVGGPPGVASPKMDPAAGASRGKGLCDDASFLSTGVTTTLRMRSR